MTAKEEIIKIIEAKQQQFFDAADAIWETPETRFATEQSVANYYPILAAEGFAVESNVAHMAHAFVATYGSGKPVIGILAEYDALSNLSQVADLGEKQAAIPGGNGHACGHNLLGMGALAGAVGIKEYMQQNDLKGTIMLFGCPAEESGYGKAFMARDGVFDDVDIMLTWHPMDTNSGWGWSSLAVYQAYFNFTGISAHAASDPEKGRSALDAAELMNIGVQFLREHVVEQARIHYAFIDAGGESANVVQPTASLHYLIRAPKMHQVEEIFERVKKIAAGAALMTETEVEIVFDSACANYLPNHVLTTVMYENLQAHGSLELTAADQVYSQRYYDSLVPTAKEALTARAKRYLPEADDAEIQALASMPVLTYVEPLVFSDATLASTDVGDVSWLCPTAQVMIACEPQGTAPHSWQWVANGKSTVAHKGLLAAGKVIATTAYDLLVDAELVAAAKQEHAKTMAGQEYRSAIPAEVMPR